MESILYMVYLGGLYWHEGTDPRLCRLYGKDKVIHKVRVTEGESQYWGFWDNEIGRFINIWPSRGQVTMCYPYGTDILEAEGRGKVVNVKVEYLQTIEDA
jgi:hypothetical protein